MPETSTRASTPASTRPAKVLTWSGRRATSVLQPGGGELTGRDGQEVGRIGVEPRAGADDVAEDVDVGTERVERRLELLLLGVEQRQQAVDLLERRSDLGLVVVGDALELPGQ